MSKYFVNTSLRVMACGKRFSLIHSSPDMRELILEHDTNLNHKLYTFCATFVIF